MLRPHKLANNLLGLGNNPGHSISDGISYWKGKKVISLEEWNKITEPKDRLESFPHEYRELYSRSVFLITLENMQKPGSRTT